MQLFNILDEMTEKGELRLGEHRFYVWCKVCVSFSLVLLFNNLDVHDRIRKALIEYQIYPAVLWNVPDTASNEVIGFSQRMLSIHCDGRYSADDIHQMKAIIESIL